MLIKTANNRYRTDEPQVLIDALLALGEAQEDGATRYRQLPHPPATALAKLQRGGWAMYQNYTNWNDAYITIYASGRVVVSGFYAGACVNDLKLIIDRQGRSGRDDDDQKV